MRSSEEERRGGEAGHRGQSPGREKVSRGRDVEACGQSAHAGAQHAARFSKDYERLPATAEAMIYGAMSRLMLRRLVRAA